MGLEWIILPVVALLASLMTFFTGFGLGTLLMPVMMIWFPVEIAIAMTAIVHVLNNFFKISLIYTWIDTKILFHFGIPAMLFAVLGGWALFYLSDLQAWFQYQLFSYTFFITPIKLIIGLVILFFVWFEMRVKDFSIQDTFLPLGGALSGFFGGLSGHQGALRSMFLVHANVTKQSYIATSSAIACLIDIGRIGVYGSFLANASISAHTELLILATAFAFMGVLFGKKYLKKITLVWIQKWVTLLLILISVLLILGLI